METGKEEFIERFHKYPQIQTFLRNQNWDYDFILALSESSSVEKLANKLNERGLDDLDSIYLAKIIISLSKSSNGNISKCNSIQIEPVTSNVNSAPPIVNPVNEKSNIGPEGNLKSY